MCRNPSWPGRWLGVVPRGGLTPHPTHTSCSVRKSRHVPWVTLGVLRAVRAHEQDGATGFFAVWDHWLLDTLSSWQRQAEAPYAIEMHDDREPSPPSTRLEKEAALSEAPSSEPVAVVGGADDGLPPRKRPRSELGLNGVGLPHEAAYLNGTVMHRSRSNRGCRRD